AASTASGSDPTCQFTSAPPSCAASTSLACGALQKKSTIRARAPATATASGSICSVMKLTASAPAPASIQESNCAASSCGCTPSGALTVPTPPARATASASPDGEISPIGACWIGTSQPTSSVNRVLSTVKG